MRARFLLIPLMAAAALLAGCATTTPPAPAATDNGVSALTAQEILDKAQEALAAAKSFHVKGGATESGKALAIDMTLAGADFKGTITVDGQAIELIKIGTDLYMKAPDEFWKGQLPAGQSDAILLLLKGKYVKVSATAPGFSEMANLADPKGFLDPSGTVTKGSPKDINGQPTIALTDTDGSLYVATTGKPYPIRIEGSEAGQSLDFSDFDATVKIEAPPASQVFDLQGLIGG
jgi:hypothetical protein